MTPQTLGHLISLLFFVTSLISIGLGIFMDYLHPKLSYKKKKALNIGMFFLASSLFSLLITENGISLEAFVLPLMLFTVMFVLEKLSAFFRDNIQNRVKTNNFSALWERIRKFINTANDARKKKP